MEKLKEKLLEKIKSCTRGDIIVGAGSLGLVFVLGIMHLFRMGNILHHKWILGFDLVLILGYSVFMHLMRVYEEKFEFTKIGEWIKLGGFFLSLGAVLYLNNITPPVRYEFKAILVATGIVAVIFWLAYVRIDTLKKQKKGKEYFGILLFMIMMSILLTPTGLYAVGQERECVTAKVTDKDIHTRKSGRRSSSTHYYIEVDCGINRRFSVSSDLYDSVGDDSNVKVGIGESLFGIKYWSIEE